MSDNIRIRLPEMELPEQFSTPTAYLRLLVMQQAELNGLLAGDDAEIYHQRIDYELAAFERCNAIGDLLKVWDFIITCETISLMTINRCMAFASLVCYLLGLTPFDPVKYGLMFSRFVSNSATSLAPFEFSVGEDMFELGSFLRESGYDVVCGGDKNNENSITLRRLPHSALIVQTLDLIDSRRGFYITPESDIPLDDAATYCMLSDAATDGIPHLQGKEVAQTLFMLRPTRFDELIPLCAMNRAGADDKLFDYRYVANRTDSLWWEKELDSPPIIVYQEQISRMALARGFSVDEAEQIRKWIGKKQPVKLEAYRQRWIDTSDEESWNLVVDGGLYAFPKAYAIVLAYEAYVCAYLKNHFPEEYTRAALCVVAGNYD